MSRIQYCFVMHGRRQLGAGGLLTSPHMDSLTKLKEHNIYGVYPYISCQESSRVYINYYLLIK
jgi:hypothetical protein